MKKNRKKYLLWMLLNLMAAVILMPLNATAQGTPTEISIAVVSDIHVMAPDLLKNNAATQEPWISDYANERKMLVESAGLFDQFVTTMIAQKPNILLITGDLTKDGELASHAYVAEKLTALETAGIQVYVIPGNHDITTTTSTIYKYDGGTRTALTADEKMTSTAAFASFYDGFGYGIEENNDNNFVQDPNGSLSYVAEIATGLYLLAIDSHGSSVSEATLDWICDQAQVIRGAGKRVIAMMHHPLFPHIEGANMFISTYTVADYTTVRNALINAGVNVILTGHFHTSDIAYDWKDDADNGIYDINTGSLISYPCDYRILTLSADKSTLNVNTYSLPETEALQPIESENRVSWKKWLQGRMAAKIAAQYNTNLAVIAAKAFILHADGDENDSPTSPTIFYGYELLTSYNEIDQSQRDTFEPILYSMLEDKSNYGNDHENQTNDRTLSDIVLTTSGTGTLDNALNLLNNEDNRTVINLYDGEKNVTVTLSGRTLYKDGAWNTICLPFSLTAEQISTYLSPEADIRALSADIVYDGKTTGFDNDNNTLILNFTPKAPAAGSVTTIEAGRPYIIKWDNTNNTNETITNPVFTGVTIDKTPHDNGNANVVTFCGTYAWQKFTDDNTSILLIGKNNSNESVLYYPKPALTNPNQVFNAETNPWIYPSLGACRAYFQLAKGYTAGDLFDPEGGGSYVRNYVLNFGDDDSATGIIAIGNSQSSTLNAQRSEWFTLDGRRLAAKPTAKGLYIHAGRKVVIK